MSNTAAIAESAQATATSEQAPANGEVVEPAAPVDPERELQALVANQIVDTLVLMAGLAVEACRHDWQAHWDEDMFTPLLAEPARLALLGEQVQQLDTLPPMIALAQEGHIEAVRAAAKSLAKAREVGFPDEFAVLVETAIWRLSERSAERAVPVHTVPSALISGQGTAENLRSRWQTAVCGVVDALNDNADARDYCGEYESALDFIWQALSNESPGRYAIPDRVKEQDYDVSGTLTITVEVPVTVTVSAVSGDDALSFVSDDSVDVANSVTDYLAGFPGISYEGASQLARSDAWSGDWEIEWEQAETAY